MELVDLKTILLSGMVLGSMYALMSSGLAMVFGTLRVFNFAHGSLVMFGAYIAWWVYHGRGLDAGMTVGVTCSLIILFLIGILIYRILVKPFLDQKNLPLIVVITTLGASILLDNLAHIIWGARLKRLARMIEGKIGLLGTYISAQEFLVVFLAPAIVVLLAIFLKRTRLGYAIRGVEQNRDAALLLGVNVTRIYAFTFGLSASLAALAGIIVGSIRFMTPSMGGDPLLRAFIVVILGGVGSLSGTLLAAFIVGLVESASMFYFGIYVTPAVLFLMMIMVLIFRPQGLFGVE
jgi:branched-chain amino acid transport system permease protein